MTYLHLTSYLHLPYISLFQRDLAARNVLLTHDLEAKVADFGLSSRIYMRTNQTVGANQDTFPFRWSAYEILENGVAIKEKSDVWSFGILMWEIFYLGAALPYADLDGYIELKAFLQANKRLDRPPLCPQDIYGLMLWCWNQPYQFRPTFAELKQELDNVPINQSTNNNSTLRCQINEYTRLVQIRK